MNFLISMLYMRSFTCLIFWKTYSSFHSHACIWMFDSFQVNSNWYGLVRQKNVQIHSDHPQDYTMLKGLCAFVPSAFLSVVSSAMYLLRGKVHYAPINKARLTRSVLIRLLEKKNTYIYIGDYLRLIGLKYPRKVQPQNQRRGRSWWSAQFEGTEADLNLILSSSLFTCILIQL